MVLLFHFPFLTIYMSLNVINKSPSIVNPSIKANNILSGKFKWQSSKN